MKIQLIKKNPNLIIPTRSHYDDAGVDCYALEDCCLPPMKRVIDPNMDSEIKARIEPYGEIGGVPISIPLGFGLAVPNGYMASIRTRSSMNKKGILCQVGTIDSGYRGEISCILVNLTNKPYMIHKGDKICQIVIEPVIIADFVENFGTERGDGGFGSTGK